MTKPATSYEEYNLEVQRWTAQVKAALKDKFQELDIQHVARSPSPSAARDQIDGKTGKRYGMVSRISIKFPRHMVFVEKGVGKGVPIALAGSNATTRRPKPWFNPVVHQEIEKLGDIVAEMSADIAVANFRIR